MWISFLVQISGTTTLANRARREAKPNRNVPLTSSFLLAIRPRFPRRACDQRYLKDGQLLVYRLTKLALIFVSEQEPSERRSGFGLFAS